MEAAFWELAMGQGWQEAVGETGSAARGYGLQPGIWKSEENTHTR